MIEAARNQRRHRRNQFRRGLIVRMNHGDEVRPVTQSEPIACLLVPSIAENAIMPDRDRLGKYDWKIVNVSSEPASSTTITSSTMPS